MNNENGSIGSFQDEANYTVESEKKLIEIVKPNHNDEKMLPVHFLPEGKQAYDWINSQLNSQAEKNTKALESVVYKSSKLDITGDSEAEKQLLLKAAENGKLEQVKEILSKQPLLVNAKDSDGYTALHRSSYSGHINIVKYLIEKGANVDGKTDDGWRPIHCATRWNHVDVCRILIESNSNVNATTNGSQTPLHLAATSRENVKILEMLLLHPDIDISIRNGAGDLAYDIASRSGNHVKLFELRDEAMKT